MGRMEPIKDLDIIGYGRCRSCGRITLRWMWEPDGLRVKKCTLCFAVMRAGLADREWAWEERNDRPHWWLDGHGPDGPEPLISIVSAAPDL